MVDDLRLDDFSLAQASFQSLDDSLEVGRRETEAASCTCGRDEASASSKQNTAEEVVRVEGSLLRCHSQRSSSLPSIPSMVGFPTYHQYKLTALYEKIQNETQSIRMQEDSASCPPSTPIRPNVRAKVLRVTRRSAIRLPLYPTRCCVPRRNSGRARLCMAICNL